MKTFLKVFLILFALLTIALAVFLLTFDINSWRGVIEYKLSSTLGRTVKIGSLDMKMSLIPIIRVQDIQIDSGEKSFSDKPFLKVDTAEITLALLPLWSKRFEIQSVSFNTLDVNLISRNGRNNWYESKIKTPRMEAEEKSAEIRLDNFSVANMNITYQNAENTYTYKGKNFSLKQLKVFSMNADINTIPFKISGTVDSLWDFIQGKPDYLFNIEFDGAGFITKLSGSIGEPQRFKKLLLNIDISGANLKKTADAIGMSNKLWPTQSFDVSTVMQGDLSELTVSKLDIMLGGNKLKGAFTGLISDPLRLPMLTFIGNINLSDRALSHFWGLNPFTADLSFILNKDGLSLNNLSLRANRTDLQLSGKIAEENKKLNVVISAVSEYFDTQDVFFNEEMFYAPELTPYGQNKQTALIKDKRIDLTLLKNMNAIISVRVPHLKLFEGLRGYIGLSGMFILKDGILSAAPFNLDILDSNMAGELKVSALDDSYYLKLIGEDLQLNNILYLSEILSNAKADISLDLSGHGKTTKEILSSLNGQVIVDMSQGVIINDSFNDLAEKLGEQKKFSVSRSTTDLESKILCGILKANIKDGQIGAENNMALETSTINLIVGGGVDLSSETLDLTVIPSLNSKDDKLNRVLKTVGRFIKIKGPLTNLKPVLSADNALQNVMGLFDNRPYQEYQLCQQVLGRPSKAQQIKMAKQLQVLPITPKPQVVQEQPKDNSFKQLLMDSLEEALQ